MSLPIGESAGSYFRYYRSYNYDRDYKQEFYRGPCKIERKWERNGEYKEETNAKGIVSARESVVSAE